MNRETRVCVVCGVEKSIDGYGNAGRYIRRQCKECFYDGRSRNRDKLVGRRGRHKIEGIDRECKRCGVVKPVERFRSSRGRLNVRCRECNNQIKNEASKTDEARAVRLKLTRRKYKESAKFLYSYLVDHPCVDCGESDVVVLEFDHVRGKKEKSVSQMRIHCVRTIKTEIEKCEVRCKNCHRRRHSREKRTMMLQLQENNGLFDSEL